MAQAIEPKMKPKGRNPLTDLFTVTEAAEFKGVTKRAVTKAIQAGTLPAWHKRAFHLIPRKDLEAWEPQNRPKRNS